MGALSDFLAGAFGNYGQQRAQMAADKRAEAADDRRFQKQLSYAKAAEAIRRNFEATSTPQIPQPYGLPIQRGPRNWEVATRIVHPAMYDEQSGALTQPASVEEGPFMPAQDPNALKPYEAARIEEQRLAREQRGEYERGRLEVLRNKTGKDGDSGADRRAAESNTRRDRDSLALETERRLADLRAEVKGISTEKDDKGVSDFDEWLSTRGLPAGTTKQQLLEQERKRIRDELAPEYGGGKPGGSESNPADATSFSGEPPKGTWVRLPSGRVIQVR